MTTTAAHSTVHEIDIAASADVVYSIIADATRWPRFFQPTVHVERAALDDETERLRIWATGNGVLRTWSSIRSLDAARHVVTFRQEVSTPPVRSMGGTWAVLPGGHDGIRLVLTHDFEAIGDDPADIEWITRATDENSTTELGNIKRLAESRDRLAGLEFSFEDSLWIDGTAADVYAFLHDAADWPDRLPHVASLELSEEDDGALQLMSMWTTAKDGSTHLTTSARVCFPHDRIVYKQLVTPAVIAAHTGAWLIEPTGGGVLARAQHTIRLPEDAPEIKDLVRQSIGGNSRATLGFAKEFAEGR